MVQFKLLEEPQVYELRFDFNALVAAEEATGVNLMAAIGSWPGLTGTQARALLFALLLPAHPKVLVEEAGGLFTKDLNTTWRSLKAALVDADFIEVEQEQEAPAVAPVEVKELQDGKDQ